MNGQGLPIDLIDLSKGFGSIQALQPTTLSIQAGEFITLLGPSGSGKTTLLNLVAGYLTPDSGRILVGNRDITHSPPRKRNVGMVFQNYALFPHLSVYENVAYGLRARRVSEQEIHRRVDQALAMVQLEGFGHRSIQQLSGGQQQRIALARALVIEPDVLLMDEPLGALDRQLRKYVQLEIRRLQQSIRRTTIYVTHDQEEALVMSDRVGVMNAGRIEQIGSPRELYNHPVNEFVARFLGESNLLHGKVIRIEEGRGWFTLESLHQVLEGTVTEGIRPGEDAIALVRPEAVALGSAEGGGIYGRIEEVVYLGELVSLRVRLSDGQEMWCRKMGKEEWPIRKEVRVMWNPEDMRILPLSKNTQTGKEEKT